MITLCYIFWVVSIIKDVSSSCTIGLINSFTLNKKEAENTSKGLKKKPVYFRRYFIVIHL